MKELIDTFLGDTKKWYEKVFLISILGVAFLTPILFTFRLKSVFVLPKLYILAICLAIAVIMIAIKYFKEGSLILRPKKFNLLLGIYAVLLIASTLFSSNIYTSLFGTYGRFIGLFTLLTLLTLVFLIFNFVREKVDQIRVLIFSYISSIVVVVLGIIQHMGYLIDKSELNAVASRAFSTLGHANHFGGFIAQFIFVSLALFCLLKNKFLKAGIVILNLFYLYALFQTSSRGAFLAFIVASIVAAISIFALSWKTHREVMKKVLTGIIIFILISVIGIFAFKEKVKKIEVVDRTISMVEFMQDGNIPDRLSWIFSSHQMIQDRPFFGFGVSTFHDIYNQYRRLDYRTPGDEQDKIVPETAHNEYLNIAATEGLFAFIAYLAIMIYALRFIYKIAFSEAIQKKKSSKSFVLIFLASAILTYLIQVLVNFGTIGTMTPFFILLGVSLGYASNLSEPDVKIDTKGYALTGFIILLTGFSIMNLYMVHRAVKADRFLRLTEVLHLHPDFQKDGYIYHIDAMTRAVDLNPYAYNLYEELGAYDLKQAIRVAEYKKTEALLLDATSAYERALKLNNFHADTYKDVATINSYLVEVYGQVNAVEKAKEAKAKVYAAYDKSIELSPNNPLHRIIAADKYMQFGDYKKALTLYEEVRSMRPEYPGIDKKISSARGN
ncbi:MAG: O-antigen ligase family protein [Candidatus Peregrinibacteria bacterium]|nr:O-antigen ligase family protein [Candidatus Peregrinibacteria bacterium]MDZ4244488.1 O-antigen ligase family protein [Candidatus Gracilibacteria bacterium]